MKLSRITNPAFQNTLQKLSAMSLPLRLAFKLKGISTKVKEEFSKFEEVRQVALKKYGNKGEDGEVILENNNVQFSAEGIEAFVKELNELGETVVEVPSFKASELGDKVELSADELMLLEDLIVVDEPAA